ncbi:plastocyanin/azurin family copper-binding protein [Halorussus pelagicus]|uniref:plastocyanin/azurin family copper-binding protein n=1 Tax=Halorussus pelagicus TaxID=2505977 RepID=UPI000FFB3493|nr:plastocyanin/azurin family copper-binding protein [Halorussus pelagicus]
MSTEGTESVTRRGFMRTATGAAAAAGAAGTAGAAESQEEGGGGGSQEVIVGPGGSLVYDPEELTIAPGTTVNFVWESDNHNIVVDSQPDGAEWEGTEGGASKTYNSGHEYSHTFETTGTYEYFCQPHKTAGMAASITVQEGGASSGGGGPAIPSSAKSLGVATTAAMVFTLGLAYFFMKYGGDYGQAE